MPDYEGAGKRPFKIEKGRTVVFVPVFALAASTSRFEVFALQKIALPAGNVRNGALSKQLTSVAVATLLITLFHSTEEAE
jgi:hypothetical protein